MPPRAACSAAFARLTRPSASSGSLARLSRTPAASSPLGELLRSFGSTPEARRHRFTPLPTKAPLSGALPSKDVDGKVAAARAQYEEVIHKYAVSGARRDGELVLRCTIFDKDGKVSRQQFKKSDLCSAHGLDPRDLRRVDSATPNLVPTIIVRQHAILATVLHIRALIKADTVIVFDVVGSKDSRLQSGFVDHLVNNLKMRQTTIPYEFRAVESVLVSVCGALEAELTYTRKIVNDLLLELEDNLSREKLRSLLHHSRRLTGFNNRATGVMDAIEEVLENDEDMSEMYLSEKLSQTPGEERDIKDHTEVEILLESVQKQVEEIVNEVETTIANVASTQEIVELMLDANRNKLLALDLKVSIMTLGVGSAALLAGLGGMNLQNHFETHPNMFYYISSLAVTLAVISSMIGLRHLRKVMRIGLADSDSAAQASYRWLDTVGRPAGAGLIGKSVTERATVIPAAGSSVGNGISSLDGTAGASAKLKASRGGVRKPL